MPNVTKNSPTATLAELIETARAAHQGVVCAFANAIDHAIAAGRALNAMEPHLRRGQWAQIYKKCDVGERQAERYRHLARLVEANPSPRTDLSGLSIQAAIKKLAPAKPQSNIAPNTDNRRTSALQVRATTHVEILDVWLRAPLAEQKRAVDAIGLSGWLAAAPESWRSSLAPPCIDMTPPADDPALPADLSIPEVLLRRAPALRPAAGRR